MDYWKERLDDTPAQQKAKLKALLSAKGGK